MTKLPNPIDEESTRLEKLKKLQSINLNPFPSWSGQTGAKRYLTQDLLTDFERLSQREERVTIAGRLKTIRAHGGSTFAHLEDASGQLQIYLKKDSVGDESYYLFQDTIDIGDFVSAEGTLTVTKRGEKTLLVQHWKFLVKALLPPPEKFHGLQDVELRYRKRYLDLIANTESRRIADGRITLIKALREFFDAENFKEVETPILQPLYGGAAARPFKTHHHALDTDLYLRIAPELYLKRLLIGGFEKVYEIARCFRNEGIDHAHNPEFTQIEFYWAYANYEDLMVLTEKLFQYLLPRMGLSMQIEYQGVKIDFMPPFPRKTFRELLIEYGKIDIEEYPDAHALLHKAQTMHIEVTEHDGKGKILDELYKTLVRPHIVQPLFMINHPVELSPLAKRVESDPRYTERMQLLVAGGFELCNAFSELNDPLDQETRFKEQERLLEAGDEEAQRYDADFITALKHGMPPAAGLGMGIDRLTALLMNAPNLKEVILFPTLRPLA
ncbi:MAG: Lysine-tRNA ligase [Candidatus Magasanikbacteria bacterium GW2011_GWA2_45_39]|uniref:Lysine--tRNA ligase n=1 Tax=Candidatus Magasanikbacteria bacterium GW2011_GWA2_45_39 TaxID=1619041 RepID=A0A0G1MF79_9BACT|nr:MAG: Lysine-tRNA ligase [Candidatus Magasanikbacteria bacterium GW2011_GWA2_45_39]HBW73914.1 lysine--tRNA ligase [Candidatus Magasanikbacteria bacterium]